MGQQIDQLTEEIGGIALVATIRNFFSQLKTLVCSRSNQNSTDSTDWVSQPSDQPRFSLIISVVLQPAKNISLRESTGIIKHSPFRVSWDQPIRTNLSGNLSLFTTGLPGSGAVLSFILNVFDDYNFSPASIADFNATILTYHRMIETFKYAYAFRTNLGDENFVDMAEVNVHLEVTHVN